MPRLAVLGLAMFTLALGPACVDADKEMTGDDAREFARRALEDAGFERVRVARRVEPGVFRPEASGRAIEVWETRATVDGGDVMLFVARSGNRAVYLNDVGEDGGPLLSEGQFDRLERFRLNPASDRQRRRLVVPGIVATVLVAAVGAGLGVAVHSGRVVFRPAELARRASPFRA